MARPAKNTTMINGHRTRAETEIRKGAEESFKNVIPKIPKELTKNQKKIYRFILGALPPEVLCAVDIYILTVAAVSIDRLQTMDFALNRLESGNGTEEDTRLVSMLARDRDKYMKDFFRCCNELCLSPQSRAKIGTAAVKNISAVQDPLAAILGKYSGD